MLAHDSSVICEIKKDRFAIVLREGPAVAEELGAFLEARAEAEHTILVVAVEVPHSAALSSNPRVPPQDRV
jgi:hypothetical protein